MLKTNEVLIDKDILVTNKIGRTRVPMKFCGPGSLSKILRVVRTTQIFSVHCKLLWKLNWKRQNVPISLVVL